MGDGGTIRWFREEEMNYPTLEQVEGLDRVALGRMYRYLRSPLNAEEIVVLRRVLERFQTLGGWDSALSRLVDEIESGVHAEGG